MKPIDSANPQYQDSPGLPPRPASNQSSAKINLLKTRGIRSKNSGRSWLKIILALIAVLIVILGGLIAWRAGKLSEKIFVGKKITLFGLIRDAIRGGGDNGKLVGEDLGQINILLLGIGGEGHDGPYLTDTMILAEIRPDNGSVTLVSIPRDYWVTYPKNGGEGKINGAFSYGLTGSNYDWNEAGAWARQVAENLSGLQIPYFAVLDFSGFEKAINQVGGIDVYIERGFTDYSFPNDATYGYLPPQSFSVGWEHMDGRRALIFARSRHSADPIEGSDFARGLRQQKIIQAFKQKVLNLNLVSNASTINQLLDTFADHFHTNIAPGEIYRLYSLAKANDIKNFASLSLDPDTSLICPEIMPDTGAYILARCPGVSQQDIENFFKNAYARGLLGQEKATIWLADSTQNSRAYQIAQAQLKQAGLTVWELPYKGPKLSTTVFYQANPKPATADFVKTTLNASEATLPPPGVKADKNRVDIVIVLGGN